MAGQVEAVGRNATQFKPGDEDIPGRDRVAVIGYGLWRQAFGGDPGAIGSTIRLNDVPLTVIGVAPRSFDFPEKTAVWTPTAYGDLPSSYRDAQTIGRLKPGVTFDRASTMYLADVDRVRAGGLSPRTNASSRTCTGCRTGWPVPFARRHWCSWE